MTVPKNALINIPELKKFTQMIMESSDDLITVIDHRGIIIAMNPAVGRLLSVNPKQLMGQSLVKVVYEGQKI